MENDMDLSTVFGTYRSFEDWLKDPENPHVYCLLTMDGKKFLAKESYHVELHQKTNAHDTFKITVNDDAIDSFTGFVLENSKNMLGNEITITYHQYGQIMQSFTGIIGGINNNKKGTGYGDLIITGFSPSILLESGKDCRSFESKTLEQIIKEVCEIYPTESRVKVELPNVKQVLPYTVQYKESDYEFIQRLAKRHGEFLYYDGEQLLFGREIQPIVKLREGDELLGIKYALKIGAQDFSYLAYDAETGEKIEQDSASIQAQYKTDPFQSVAENRSKPLFKKKPKMHFNQTGIIDGQAKNELEEAVRLEKERRASLMQITGKSIAPFLRMGSLAEFTDINKHAMETYRILEISHYHNGGSYYNEFTGIPDVFTAPYSDEDAFPKGEEQPARVTDNNDPKGMGRVRVQFPWQEEKNQMTPWLRIVTNYAGAGKGNYFVPEVGEEVLINFENGNAEKPYVAGALYNGKETSSYHTANNDLKVIKTRSGHTIIMDDSESKQSITILDISGNTIYMDTISKDISITAPNNINISAGNDLNISAGQNMNTNVGQNISTSAGNNIGIVAGNDITETATGNRTEIADNRTEMVEKDYTRQSDISDIIAKKITATSSEEDILIQSAKTVHLNSGEKGTNH